MTKATNIARQVLQALLLLWTMPFLSAEVLRSLSKVQAIDQGAPAVVSEQPTGTAQKAGCLDAPDHNIFQAASREGLEVKSCADAAEKNLCPVASAACPVSCGTCGRRFLQSPVDGLSLIHISEPTRRS
eukprot:4909397-Prymnesium_polylepis.1